MPPSERNRVRITLSADGTDAEQAFRSLDRQIDKTQRNADQTQRSFFDLEKAARHGADAIRDMGFIVGTAATGLAYMTDRSLRATTELKKQAEMAGINVEAYQELVYAGKQYQITQDALTDGLKELAMRADEFVQNGAGPAEEAFKRLGFTQDELAKKLNNTPALLTEIVDRLQDMDKAAQIRIFDEIAGGQAGEQFTAMVDAGAAALRGFIRDSRELGVVMSESLIDQAEDARHKIDTLSTAVSMQFNVAVAELAPDIARVADSMGDWVANNREFIQQDIPDYISRTATEIKTLAGNLSDIPEPVLYGGLGAIFKGLPGAAFGVGYGIGEMLPGGNDPVGHLERLQAHLKELEATRQKWLEAADLSGIGQAVSAGPGQSAMGYPEEFQSKLDNLNQEIGRTIKLIGIWSDSSEENNDQQKQQNKTIAEGVEITRQFTDFEVLHGQAIDDVTDILSRNAHAHIDNAKAIEKRLDAVRAELREEDLAVKTLNEIQWAALPDEHRRVEQIYTKYSGNKAKLQDFLNGVIS